MNFVFISPHFPDNYWNFCDRLHRNGVTVLGIGDAPYESLRQELKEALTEYYRVDNMKNYDEMFRAMAFFSFHYGHIDWVESNNEYWLEQDALLRSDFNICSGLKAHEISRYKSKSLMKEYYAKAGIPTARWRIATTLADARRFVREVGWPLIAKPDNGVGAEETYALHNYQELKSFFAVPNRPKYLLEEYIDGEVVTYDGVSDGNAQALYAASHITPEGPLAITNGLAPLWYYVDPQMSPVLRRMGEDVLKSFDARNRFFHCEFFRLKSDKPGLGKAGDFLGLEVNMRPAGGYTVDMLNYAGSVDLYQLWADMVAFGKSRHPIETQRQFCCCTSRRDGKSYRYTHEQILQKYADHIKMTPRLPAVLARAMGDQLYLATFTDGRNMRAFRTMVQAVPR